MTSKFNVGLAVALGTFIVGLVSASLWVVHNHRPPEQLPPVQAVAVRQTPHHPDGWKKIDVDERFSFYLPPDVKPEKELDANIEYFGPNKSFGSKTLNVGYIYVEKWRNEELWRGRVSCDVLMGKLAAEPGSQASEVETSGKRAKQVSGQYAESKLVYTKLCFPDAGDGTILRIEASYKEDRAVDATKIISSIEFR
jgi:hypothetical protein